MILPIKMHTFFSESDKTAPAPSATNDGKINNTISDSTNPFLGIQDVINTAKSNSDTPTNPNLFLMIQPDLKINNPARNE